MGAGLYTRMLMRYQAAFVALHDFAQGSVNQPPARPWIMGQSDELAPNKNDPLLLTAHTYLCV